MDTEPRYENLSRKAGVFVGGIAVLFSIVLSNLTASNTAWAAGIVAIVMLSAIMIYWHLRRARWFWIAVGTIALLHGVGVILIPWSKVHYPAPYLLAPTLLDIFLVVACIRLIGRIFDRKTDDAARKIRSD